ncbi:predicted protein [Scheffersomyces stipitis CBS 6054]|uniref:Uncharacterized protein n=1 Tax=Scheffersomyces stipitis (strain ATCC 58785 / CBS 6054 / NBRC 10063 / NRRL Y-11545) TaxID=322104 RepID=A3LWE9_PICST|nr:predicted protein [Scheffersomyces stipitis CBS 6054]ABN66961.2 predicted protein [Scheffersomyces stipitis CBS 6054]KAG2734238.1 hypothetical protein G9P44_002244 [Scheffersomyces stipitis]
MSQPQQAQPPAAVAAKNPTPSWVLLSFPFHQLLCLIFSMSQVATIEGKIGKAVFLCTSIYNSKVILNVYQWAHLSDWSDRAKYYHTVVLFMKVAACWILFFYGVYVSYMDRESEDWKEFLSYVQSTKDQLIAFAIIVIYALVVGIFHGFQLRRQRERDSHDPELQQLLVTEVSRLD